MKCKQPPLLNLFKLAVVWSWVGPIRWLYIWHLEGIFHWAKWADKKLVCKQRLRAFAIQKCGSVLSSALVYLVLWWTGSNNFIRPHTTRLLRAPLTNLPLHNISLLLLVTFIQGLGFIFIKKDTRQRCQIPWLLCKCFKNRHQDAPWLVVHCCQLLSIVANCCPLLPTVAHCCPPPLVRSAMVYFTIDCHILPLTGLNDFVYWGLNAQKL